MIIPLLIGFSLIQLGLYHLNRKYGQKVPELLILLTFLVCYFLVIPRFFYPDPRPDGINCAMPTLGITLAFWIFGTIAGFLTHAIWIIIKRISTKVQHHR
ncbi:conserved hypothetical protein [Tenacibaculum sp. 190130A14a]|uniref:Uncharacterized protein n=1 Tax=Tenacibaculum polynesiense TaxID=3137857 RepID=A0ABP1F4Y6_9FLAO